MGKFGKQRKQQLDRTALVVENRRPMWARPEGELDDERVIRFYSGYADLHIIDKTQRLSRNGQLVEFAVLLKDYSESEEFEVMCIDSHGDQTIHIHRDNHKSPKETIMEIARDGDLDKGYHAAQDIIQTKAKEEGER